MPMDVEERYERRAPFGVPFAESFGLHLLVIGALASSVWLHSRIRGNEWGQNLDGAIQANLVSNAPSIPLPQIQKPTDNVLATENPSPAPAIEKEQTVPAPDLKAIPIPVKQPPKKEPPPKKDVHAKAGAEASAAATTAQGSCAVRRATAVQSAAVDGATAGAGTCGAGLRHRRWRFPLSLLCRDHSAQNSGKLAEAGGGSLHTQRREGVYILHSLA